jgi:hypothetical protein
MAWMACTRGACGPDPAPARSWRRTLTRRLLAVAIAEATWGAARLAAYAQRLWRLMLEHQSAAQAGLLTERTRQALWRVRHRSTRHVEAERDLLPD